MADGTSRPISQVKVGDQVANSVPGDATLQTHAVQKVIVTQTDRDFVDLTVKKVAAKLGKAAAGLAVAAAAVLGSAAPASADTSTLTTTYHHPFYDITQAAFVDAVDLHSGDQLQTADGVTAEITAVRAYHQTQTTYDLTIDGLHTYYVLSGNTPILVHNSNARGCGVNFPSSVKQGGVAQNLTRNGGGLHCEYCNQPIQLAERSRSGVTPPANDLAYDHFNPVAAGGKGTPDNLVIACRQCNGEKSDRDPQEFLLSLLKKPE